MIKLVKAKIADEKFENKEKVLSLLVDSEKQLDSVRRSLLYASKILESASSVSFERQVSNFLDRTRRELTRISSGIESSVSEIKKRG